MEGLLEGTPGKEGGALDGIGDAEGMDGVDGGDCDCCGDLQAVTPKIRSIKSTPGNFVIAHPPMLVRLYWLPVNPILLERIPQWEFAWSNRYSVYIQTISIIFVVRR